VSKQDTHFFNVFSVVLGILVVIAIVIFAFSRRVEDDTGDSRQATDPLLQREVVERIRPFGQVAVAGKDNSALAIAPAPGAAEPATGAAPTAGATQTVAQPAGGEGTYNAACAVCHGAGIAGAPKFADKAAWAPRLAQGAATLHKHALEGFQGKAGVMPPKGGRADLPDDAIVAAVDYMAEAAR
jgi:cytochrome c5